MAGISEIRDGGPFKREKNQGHQKMNKQVSTETTDQNIARIMDLLSETSLKLENISARLSKEQLQLHPGTGERSFTENLAHLLHCEAISSEFIYLALLKGENEGQFNNIHPEREYGKLLRYDLFPFASLLDYFKFRRTVLLRVLNSLSIKQWSQAVPQKGKKRKETVYSRARSMALHEFEHLSMIENKFKGLK